MKRWPGDSWTSGARWELIKRDYGQKYICPERQLTLTETIGDIDIPTRIAYPLALFKHLIKFSSDFISAFRRKAKTERESFSRNFEFEVRWKCAVGDANSGNGQLERYRRESAGCNQPAKPRQHLPEVEGEYDSPQRQTRCPVNIQNTHTKWPWVP